MNTDDAATNFSSCEEDLPLYFSERLKRRRQELDLSQEQLAQRASCSVFAIRKMESGERRPSRQLAELLAKALEIPTENQSTFIQVAPGSGVSNACAPSFPVALPCQSENPDQPPETCRCR